MKKLNFKIKKKNINKNYRVVFSNSRKEAKEYRIYMKKVKIKFMNYKKK